MLLSLLWWYAQGLELGASYTFAVQAFPYWCLVTLGCYAMGSIGYKLWVLEDCKEDERSLQEEMKEARAELAKKGFKFDAGKPGRIG